jgi:eukaryotic-like serine/threonine-protein kinase
MVVLPRVGRRLGQTPRIRRLVGRLRRRSMIDRVLSWVEDEQPDLAGAAAPDGTVTILFTDIENSTALNERLGDRRWLEVLRAHNSVVRHCIGGHGGYEVKSQGDGFMIAYPSARRGLECAVDMQHNLARLADADPGERLRVRIGLHTGEAIREGDDFYGRSVTLAARLGDKAEGGEILVHRPRAGWKLGRRSVRGRRRAAAERAARQPARVPRRVGEAGGRQAEPARRRIGAPWALPRSS